MLICICRSPRSWSVCVCSYLPSEAVLADVQPWVSLTSDLPRSEWRHDGGRCRLVINVFTLMRQISMDCDDWSSFFTHQHMIVVSQSDNLLWLIFEEWLLTCCFVPWGRDPCLVNPCHNNGTCVYVATSYECQCPEGFEGRYCQTGQTSFCCLLLSELLIII